MLDAWIGLGSNLGDRRKRLEGALKDIRDFALLIAVSSVYETPPVGPVTDQPLFYNAAAHLQTELEPRELLFALLGVERAHGRDRGNSIPKGPRLLDLDILLLSRNGNAVISADADLLVPHPALAKREFVLEPLAEIAAELTHPTLGKSIEGLLSEYRKHARGGRNSKLCCKLQI